MREERTKAATKKSQENPQNGRRRDKSMNIEKGTAEDFKIPKTANA